ncbi:MAG: hypothetical protein KKA73_21305 [Chloroflexi bacterium]|nr:hypothetical protein [Chloroflexota bacterium]MBU1750231.1 hypothetical protein [Chloroflexota bacterium]
MGNLVWLLVRDIEQSPDVLAAWQDVGVDEITIIDSAGMRDVVRKSATRADLPLFPVLHDFLACEECRQRVLVAYVEDQKQLDQVVRVTQEALPRLNSPQGGLLLVLPVALAIGQTSQW